MKQYTLVQLSAMTLQQMADLVNVPAIAKMAKGPAIQRCFAALPDLPEPEPEVQPAPVIVAPVTKEKVWNWPTTESMAKVAAKVKVGGYKAASKFGKLYAALAELRTRAELLEASGFDNKNLSVALSIMKRAGHVIKVEVDSSKTQRYTVQTQV